MTAPSSFSFWVAVQPLTDYIPKMATNDQLKDKRHIPVEQFQQENKFLSSVDICIVCQDQPRNRVILPCAHFCICHLCANGLTHCPYKNVETNRKCGHIIYKIVCVCIHKQFLDAGNR